MSDDKLIERLRGGTMAFDWSDLPDDALIPAVPLLREAADTLAAKDTALAEMRVELERATKAVRNTLTWAEQRCPCRNEEPNPCPLCSASIENLEGCKSAENTMPRHILEMLRAASALGPSDDIYRHMTREETAAAKSVIEDKP
jgi:hypothetical protein